MGQAAVDPADEHRALSDDPQEVARRFRELRFEWLKLRSYLFDPTTRLPSLPAVLDDVRRRLEGGERLGLIYLDLSRGARVESVTGWQAYDRLIVEVAEGLAQCRSELLTDRDTVAMTGVRSDEFVLFVGLDAGRPGHLDAIYTAVVDRVHAHVGARSNGDPTAVHGTVAGSRIEVHLEPTMRIERAIYAGVYAARELCRIESEKRHSRRLVELRSILSDRGLRVRYQPIVELGNGAVHGLEALSAAPSGGIFETPEMLFTFAEESDLIVDLDRVCRREAMAHALPLVGPDGTLPGGKLFLNCSAPAFADPALVPDLLEGAESLGLVPEDLVLEVTERVAITEWQTFQRSLGEIRREGLRVAIDDMGSGYSSLHAVAEIQPDYLKFDLSLILNVHQSRIKRDLLETLVILADKIGARAIAEGIESVEEFEAVRAMGIEYGQGYFFARPAVPSEMTAVHFPARVSQAAAG